MGDRIRLLGVTEDTIITQEMDPEFWTMLQKALLLGLKDGGILSEVQYRYAEEICKAKNRYISEGKGEHTP